MLTDNSPFDPIENVEVHISGSGLTFQGKTDVFKASQIIAFLHAPGARMGRGMDKPLNTPPALAGKGMLMGKSPKEYIIECNAKTNAEKILALAKYWMDIDGKESFSVSALKPLFIKAGEIVPKNLSRDLATAISLAYIQEHEGEYVLTGTGQDALQSKFSNASQKRRTRSTGQRSDAPRIEARDEILSMEIETTMAGYPDYWKLETKGVKILWILEYALNKKVDALSNSEISSLATKLRDNISGSSVSALTEGSMKKGYLARSGGRLRITKLGSDFVKQSTEGSA